MAVWQDYEEQFKKSGAKPPQFIPHYRGKPENYAKRVGRKPHADAVTSPQTDVPLGAPGARVAPSPRGRRVKE